MYGISSIYSSVIIAPFYFPNNQTLEIFVTSDLLHAISGFAEITLMDWHGNNISSQVIPFTVLPLNNTLIYSGTGLDRLLLSGQNLTEVWLHLGLTALDGDSILTHETQVRTREIRYIHRLTSRQFIPLSLAVTALVDPQIELTFLPELTFQVSARGGVAPWTWLDHPA